MSSDAANKRAVLIVGTGDMSLGLCRQFSRYHPSSSSSSKYYSDDVEGNGGGLQKSRHALEVASPTSRGGSPEGEGGYFGDTGVVRVDLVDGLERADIVVLAIPSPAFPDFVSRHVGSLKNKVAVVDVSNPTRKGDNLAKALDDLYKNHGVDYGVRWVKAFNDVGALELITRTTDVAMRKSLKTAVCGQDGDAVAAVKELAVEAFAFDSVKVLPAGDDAGRHVVADMEGSQASVGWEWIHTFYIMLVIHFFAYLYIAVRVHMGFGVPKANMPVSSWKRVRLHR